MNVAILIRLFSVSNKDFLLVGIILFALTAAPITALATSTDLEAAAQPGVELYTGPVSTANMYDFGFCTFWAAKRRIEVSKAIPNNLGHANTWAARAKAQGYQVDHQPTQYAIMQTTAGELGHVAFVESVNADGGWTVTEMNVKGWNLKSSRAFKASEAILYNFIH